MFRPGQKVICINDQFPAQFFRLGKHLPCAGEIYTIRAISEGDSLIPGEEGPSLLLQEVINPRGRNRFRPRQEVTFCSHRFAAYRPELEESLLS